MKILKNRTVVGVLCIVLSLLICFGVTPLFTRSANEKAEIVRVSVPIHAGDEITGDMVETVQVGAYGLPDAVLRQKENVVGKYAAAELAAGDYLLPAKLSDEPAADNAYLYDLNGEQQAMSVTIKAFANGLSGKLRSGDVVSVIAPDYRKQGVTVIPPELQYVEVIGVTTADGYDTDQASAPTNDAEAEDEKDLPSTATLLVSVEQSKLLAELEADGKLHLSLVYRGDKKNADEFLDEQAKTLKELYPDPVETPPPTETPSTSSAPVPSPAASQGG